MTDKNVGAVRNNRVSRRKSNKLGLIFKIVLICLAVCLAVLIVLPDSRDTMANQWDKFNNWLVKSDGYVLASKIFGGNDVTTIASGNGESDNKGSADQDAVSGSDSDSASAAGQGAGSDSNSANSAGQQTATGSDSNNKGSAGREAATGSDSNSANSAGQQTVAGSDLNNKGSAGREAYAGSDSKSGDDVNGNSANTSAESGIAGMTTEPLSGYVPDGVQDYESLYPNLYGERANEWVVKDKMVYLTFDDGPSIYTERVLDILKEKDVKATFFVVGNSVEKMKNGSEILNRVVNEGHTLAVHCNYHDYKTIYKSVEAYLADFNTAHELIYDLTGVNADIFRFPGGSNTGYNKAVRSQLFNEMERRGFTFYDWNASTGDSSSAITVESAYENAVAKSKSANRLIILIHDTKKPSVDALARIIDRYRDLGFSFDRLLNEDKPIVL
ncbi:hypothetical protein FACS1894127_0820 [Clostridia bacterium]|nr:hypothetical protein FACS1894127_0820 [Clostridia bacterium]